jgi:DNA phosphorothioation-associated putative methyltransferase
MPQTAIKRNKLSIPMRAALEKIITPDMTIHDYGCGKGDDIRFLKELGFNVTGHDLRVGVKYRADVVTLIYVINTIESPITRLQIIQDAYQLAKKYLIVAARTDISSLKHASPLGENSFITKRGTFQKFYTTEELISYISKVTTRPVTKLTNGVVYIKKF